MNHLAKEAERLQSDELLIKALADIRADALNALATVDANNYQNIVKLQQKVAVVDEFRAMIARYIMAADVVQEDAGSFA